MFIFIVNLLNKLQIHIFIVIFEIHQLHLHFYRAMLSTVYVVIVCPSVALRYCIKMAKLRITQITPHDSPMTLVF